jgi:hypothetical protein
MKKILSIVAFSAVVFAGCVGIGQKFVDPVPVKPEPVAQEYFKLETPISGSSITSPIEIAGQAKGPMFFEGSFPISIQDIDGKVLGTDTAKAIGDWMTEKDVPFKATLTFKKPTTKTGFIILKNDNPSGLPENEHSVKFPISFK